MNPKTINDFGDYQCRADNRLGREERNINLREATPPKFAPQLKLKGVNPESVLFDIVASNAPESDGGMPIEGYKIDWRYSGADSNAKTYQKEFQLDLTSIEAIASAHRDITNAEIDTLLPDTEYLFRVAAVNKPGVGKWSTNEIKLRTAKRRQPDPVKIESKEDCQSATRCYIEWNIDSNGGSPIREFMVRWRRVIFITIIPYSIQSLK